MLAPVKAASCTIHGHDTRISRTEAGEHGSEEPSGSAVGMTEETIFFQEMEKKRRD